MTTDTQRRKTGCCWNLLRKNPEPHLAQLQSHTLQREQEKLSAQGSFCKQATEIFSQDISLDFLSITRSDVVLVCGAVGLLRSPPLGYLGRSLSGAHRGDYRSCHELDK